MSAGGVVQVLHLGALGDSVLTWPLLAGLRRWRPQACLRLAGSGSRARLARNVYLTSSPGGPLVDEVDALDGPDWTELFGPTPSPVGKAGRRLSDAGVIVSLVSGVCSTWDTQLRSLSRGEVYSVDPRPRPGIPQSLLDQWLGDLPADLVGCVKPHEAVAWRGRGALRGPQKLAVLHPGGGAVAKWWPMTNFEAIGEDLSRQGWTVQWVLGEAETQRGLTPDRCPKTAAVIVPETLDELAAVLAGCDMLVGNDSGPAHLAAQLGTPTVAVFVAGDPRVWHPRGPRTAVVGDGRGPPCVEDVRRACRTLMAAGAT